MKTMKKPFLFDKQGTARWNQIAKHCKENSIELSPADQQALADYCSNLDLIFDARAAIKKDGMTVLNSASCIVPHPLLSMVARLQSTNIQLCKNIKLFSQADKAEANTDDDLDFL
jgi:P27 family predicted phage terminase small subunit